MCLRFTCDCTTTSFSQFAKAPCIQLYDCSSSQIDTVMKGPNLHSESLLKTHLIYLIKLHSFNIFNVFNTFKMKAYRLSYNKKDKLEKLKVWCCQSPFPSVPGGCRGRVVSGVVLGCCSLAAEWALPYLSPDKQTTCGQPKTSGSKTDCCLHTLLSLFES